MNIPFVNINADMLSMAVRFSSNYFLEFSNAKASRIASYNEALFFYNHYQCKNLKKESKTF